MSYVSGLSLEPRPGASARNIPPHSSYLYSFLGQATSWSPRAMPMGLCCDQGIRCKGHSTKGKKVWRKSTSRKTNFPVCPNRGSMLWKRVWRASCQWSIAATLEGLANNTNKNLWNKNVLVTFKFSVHLLKLSSERCCLSFPCASSFTSLPVLTPDSLLLTNSPSGWMEHHGCIPQFHYNVSHWAPCLSAPRLEYLFFLQWFCQFTLPSKDHCPCYQSSNHFLLSPHFISAQGSSSALDISRAVGMQWSSSCIETW